MLHAKALSAAVLYDVYLECCEGSMDASWKIEPPVDFYTFHEKLGKPMLTHSPKDRKYPGDEKFRVSTQQPKIRRHANVPRPGASVATDSSSSTSSKLTCNHFIGNSKLLCVNLTSLYYRHAHSVKTTDSPGRICVSFVARGVTPCVWHVVRQCIDIKPRNQKKKIKFEFCASTIITTLLFDVGVRQMP